MTEKEAIEIINDVTWKDFGRHPDFPEARDMAKAALEKQIAKKPDYEGDGYADGEIVYDTWICPCCRIRYEVDYDNYDYCPDCGQKIKW